MVKVAVERLKFLKDKSDANKQLICITQRVQVRLSSYWL